MKSIRLRDCLHVLCYLILAVSVTGFLTGSSCHYVGCSHHDDDDDSSFDDDDDDHHCHDDDDDHGHSPGSTDDPPQGDALALPPLTGSAAAALGLLDGGGSLLVSAILEPLQLTALQIGLAPFRATGFEVVPGDGEPFAVRALVGIEGVSLFDPSGDTLHDTGALEWFGARVLEANRDLLAWPAEVSGLELASIRSDGEWIEIAFRLSVVDDAHALESRLVLDGLGVLERIENVVGATADTEGAPAPR